MRDVCVQRAVGVRLGELRVAVGRAAVGEEEAAEALGALDGGDREARGRVLPGAGGARELPGGQPRQLASGGQQGQAAGFTTPA